MLHAAFGMASLLLVAWLLSENRRAIAWRTVMVGLALQTGLALVLIGIPAGIVRMPIMPYAVATVIGSALWCSILAWFDRWLKGQPGWWDELYGKKQVK